MMFKNLGGLGDMAKMVQAAQDMQAKMADMQESLGQISVVGESGAGLVRATVSGHGMVTAIAIDPTILVASEREIVEDLIVAAIKDGQDRATDRRAQEIARVQESLGLPAGFKLPV